MEKIFWAVVVVGLLAACSQTDELPTKEVMPDSQLIRLQVGVNDLQTRAGYDNSNLNSFGLIVDNVIDVAYSCNVEMKKTDNGWEAADGTRPMWDDKRSVVTVCAFAPYQKEVTLNGNLSIGVPVSYMDADEAIKADFLLMKAEVNPQTDLGEDGALRIGMKHKLCKLMISFTGVEEVTELKVDGTILGGTCDLSAENPVVTAIGGSGSIVPFKENDGTYQCILLPQRVESGKLIVTFTAGGRDFCWTSSKEILFEENHCYTLPLEVTGRSLSLAKDVKACAWNVTVDHR